ncbi:MAG TPA: hypothetical protein VJB14_15620 [Planctomycetota bacterium]|nr:hypothetical protein [Planctomycetota bacterium]
MKVARIFCISMMALVLGSCASTVQLSGGTIPEELVGIWATEGTELREGRLVKGEVLYLTAHRTGVSMGSGPPPMGGSLLVWFDASSSALYHRAMIGQRHARWEKTAVYDPTRKMLVPVRHPESTGTRRPGSLPKEVLENRGPELWDEERARVNAFVRDMTLYFPRLGTRALSPKEQVEDEENGFREEALDALLLADEPPLSSLGKQDLEGYRLIWIGATSRPSPFVVRVQRNRHGEVSLATTVRDQETGDALTRRRGLREEDWATLERRLAAAAYFERPLRIGEAKPDRGWWIVEGWKAGEYRYVEACGPEPGPFRDLCESIMGLGGLDPKLYGRK